MNFLINIPKHEEESLAFIRHWPNITVAFNDTTIWLRGFTLEQVNSTTLRKVPYEHIYFSEEALLFIKDTKVPFSKLPSGLLWSPIANVFPIKLGKLNHNYFGIHQKVEVQLIQSEMEQETAAMIVEENALLQYITTNSATRLASLKWCKVNFKNYHQALIIGQPSLSISGKSFWKLGQHLIPNGYTFEFEVLALSIYKKLNPKEDSIILWHTDSSYSIISKEEFTSLSIASFKLSKVN